MDLQIRARKIELTTALRGLIERRLGFALGRFGHRVQEVTIRLDDLNGPRGGMDKRCWIRATVVPSGDLTVETRDDEMESAISRAADRIARRVKKALDRRREARGRERRRMSLDSVDEDRPDHAQYRQGRSANQRGQGTALI